MSVLSASIPEESEWVYRIFDRRSVSIKAKNDNIRKLAVIDLATGLPFTVEVPESVSAEAIEVEKAYFASMRVYTAKNLAGVVPEYFEFFQVVDVDRSMDDFIKAYWLYPRHIKFELVEAEELDSTA